MKNEYIINACSGKGIDIKEGQTITVIDVEGGQVADFFAECTGNPDEFLSTSVTIDSNESLRLNIGDYIYSNLYHQMFQVIHDEVGEHDLLFPSCRKETYNFFYNNGEGHPNCFDNINDSLGEKRTIIQPVNLFMYTKVYENGKIVINPPLSKARSKIILKAMMDMRLGISACSISEGECNNGKCTSIKVVVED